jgi:hypothetical protein
MKSKSTVTNLVTFLDLVTPLIRSQGQTDSIIFILIMLLTLFHMHRFFVSSVIMDYLPIIYIDFSVVQLTDSLVYVFLVHFRRLLSCCQAYLKGQF